MRRREFLTGTAAAAGLLASGPAWARRWGSAPEESAGLLLGDGTRAQRVLEVFLYGGISPWESFYVVPEHGTPNDPDHPNQQWHNFAGQHQSVFGGACGLAQSDWLQPFGLDSAGRTVQLGPLAWPLRQRADLLRRMRIVVMRHDLEPHEAAIPQALSGMRLGSPRMVGMGAHMQRYWLENAPRVEPYAYVLQPNDIFSTDNTRAADAVGSHPGSARPLNLRIEASGPFLGALRRQNLGSRKEAFDALVSHYTQRQGERYRAGDTPLRSQSLADHLAAFSSVQRSEAIREVLGDGFLRELDATSCGVTTGPASTAMGLEAAVALLTHPTAAARYVNVIDSGLALADGGGGYDTHFDHLGPQALNSTHLLKELVARINEPGEGDPDKIDLDDTMIVLTTEFGRTPYRQWEGNGTNHHPYGYVNIILGGPVGEEQSGIVGAIGPDGTATEWITPAELRAGLLAAVGIYPFAHESFAVGDIRNVPTEHDALAWLQETVLGRSA